MLKNINALLATVLLIGLSLACSIGDETDAANKLVNEANTVIKSYNEASIKSGKLFSELLGDNLTKVEDLEVYKTENKAKFDELLSLNGQIEKNGAEAVSKFEEASKLKLDEKFKEYLGMKVQEFKKRAEADKLTAPFVKSFLETKEVDKLDKLIEDYNKKSTAVVKESEELMKKADQIVKDNPNSIKN